MNCKQANQIPLTEILEAEGFKLLDLHSGGHELRYENPLREERTASFFVNPTKNVWKDFGGEGGTPVDLVCKYQKTDISGALRWLQGFKRTTSLKEPSSAQNASKSEVRPRYELVSAGPIQNKGLIYYLHTRGISLKVGKVYLLEVSYRDTDTEKEFYGLAIKNDAGGYSVRNKYFKTALAPQGFTIIKGSTEGDPHRSRPRRWHIFEGVMDFLTVLESVGKLQPAYDTIILNSVNNAQAAAAMLEERYDVAELEFYLWMDNEIAGTVAAQVVDKALGQFTATRAVCYDARNVYTGYKDANEKWIATNKQIFNICFIRLNQSEPPSINGRILLL